MKKKVAGELHFWANAEDRQLGSISGGDFSPTLREFSSMNKKSGGKHLQDFHFFQSSLSSVKKLSNFFVFFRIFISLGGLLEEVSEKRLWTLL